MTVLHSFVSLAVLLLPFAAAVPTHTTTAIPTQATSNAQLNLLAKLEGKLYFGTATDNGELTDKPYAKILENNLMFGQLTPANAMKWENSEPTQGNFTFAAGDVIAKLAHQNGMLLRGHNCDWHSQLAPWVTEGNFTAKQLTSIIQKHCGTLVKHYEGQIYSWDVVNEPMNDDGTFRSDVFYDTLGETYIPIALQAAKAADPFAKLYINDYNIEGPSAKSTAYINLVKKLKAQRVPIDGIGVQAHLVVGQLPSGIKENLQAFTNLGVEVALTELDIRFATLPPSPADLQQQKKDYQTVIAACKEVSRCIGVTVWDWTDKYSWVPSTFPGQGAPCPWDENLKKKPAFDGIVAGLETGFPNLPWPF